MVYYLGILTLCFFLYLIDFKPKCMFLVLLGFFLCFGYMTGSDWINYEPFYYSMAKKNISSMLLTMVTVEPGYVLYNYIFSKLNINFWHFFIFTKVLIYIIVVKQLYGFLPGRSFYLSLLLFLVLHGFYLFIDNPMRNMIAVGLFLCSLKSLKNREFMKYFSWTLLAISFHFTAIFMFFLYIIANKHIATKLIVILYIIINIAFSSSDIFFTILKIIFVKIPLIYKKIDYYYLTEEKGRHVSLIMFIFHNIIFILTIISRKKIEKIPYGNVIFLFTILFLFMFRISFVLATLFRFELYLLLFYSIAVSVISDKFPKYIRLPFVFFVLAFCIYTNVKVITRDNRYIPYTNYISYFDKNITFTDRKYYNDKFSQYNSWQNTSLMQERIQKRIEN